jgi:hypothetical protein
VIRNTILAMLTPTPERTARAAEIVTAMRQTSRDQLAGRIDLSTYRATSARLWTETDAEGLHAEIAVAMREQHQAWLRGAP